MQHGITDTPHKEFLMRIKKEVSLDGKISLGRARSILGLIFRMRREVISTIFAEMQQLGMIAINGQRFIIVLD